MKKMRRTASIALALLMALVMAVPAFAVSTQTGTIAIENMATADENVKAYKVFDWKDGTDVPVYTIEETSPWFGLLANEISEGVYQSKVEGITMTKNDTDGVYELHIADTLNKAQFVKDAQDYFNAMETKPEGTDFVVEDGMAKAKDLVYGYYFISTEMGAFVNVNTASKTITDKGQNDMAFDKELDNNEHNVQVGDVVPFTLSAKVPDTSAYIGFKYVMEDKLDDGLTLNTDSITVMIGDTTLAAGADTYTLTLNENGFTLNFNMKKLTANGAHKDEMVQVKYNATVNSNAVNQVEWNNASLTYTKKTGEETLTDKEYVYTFKLIIDKTDGGANKLANAQFVLKDGDRFYSVDTNGNVSWVVDQAQATVVTTDALGAAEFAGLKAKAYQLVEIAAPEGYNKIDDPIDITLSGLTAEEVEQIAVNPDLVNTRLVLTQTVENFSGNLLPETGGIGTTIFYVVGGVLVIGAAALLIARKRAAK